MMITFEANSKSNAANTSRPSRHMSKGNLLLALLGLGLLAWVVAHAGSSAIVHQFKALRIALPVVIVLSVVRLVLQSFTWSASLQSEGIEVGLLRLI
jgi:hypothetical protein